MISEMIRVHKDLVRTGVDLPMACHPFVRPALNGTKLVKIDRKCNIVSVAAIEDDVLKKLKKIQENATGPTSGASFPCIKLRVADLTDDMDKTKTILTENVAGDLLPRLIDKFSKYSELKNFVTLMKVFSENSNFDKFARQYKALSPDDKPEDVVNLYLDLDKVSSGYYVSNTAIWKPLNKAILTEFPQEGEKGLCSYSGEETVLADPQTLKVNCSKKLFGNGVCLYNRNILKYERAFSFDGKLQISQDLANDVRSAAEWILSDGRFKKNSYPIDAGSTVFVCWLIETPEENVDFARLLCDGPVNHQENAVEDIQGIFNSVMSSGKSKGSSQQQNLAYFIIENAPTGCSTFVQGEGIVLISKVIKALDDWKFSDSPAFYPPVTLKETGQPKISLGMRDVYKVVNMIVPVGTPAQKGKKGKKPAVRISFSDIFNRIFLDTDVRFCKKVLEDMINLHWPVITKTGNTLHNFFKKYPKEAYKINDILLTMKLLQNKIYE